MYNEMFGNQAAVDYLIRRRSIQKKRFVIKRKIILASYGPLIVYLLLQHYGIGTIIKAVTHVEPIVYLGVVIVGYSFFYLIRERQQASQNRNRQ